MSKPKNLDQRMLAIMHDLGGLEKTGTAHKSVGGYRYHAIDDIEAHLRPLLVKHGVVCWVSGIDVGTDQMQTKSGSTALLTDAKLTLTFRNADDPEDSITVQAFGQGIDTGDKAAGKAISYALKNLYLALFHMRGKEDNEAGEQIETALPNRMTQDEADTIKLYGKEIKARTAADDEEARVILAEARAALNQADKMNREKTESLIRKLADFLKGLKSEAPHDHPDGLPLSR